MDGTSFLCGERNAYRGCLDERLGFVGPVYREVVQDKRDSAYIVRFIVSTRSNGGIGV
jgi:hypothetical protein